MNTPIYLIPLLPFLAAAFTTFLRKSQRKLSSGVVISAMAVSLLLSLRALLITIQGAHHDEVFREAFTFSWLVTGTQSLELGFVLDPLSAVMLVMVSFVSLLVFIYSTGYMGEDKNYARFFCFLSLFAGSMLGLVISNSLLMMFIFWELVGVSSYALIGFWFYKPSAAEACKKAFITTRIGDVGFFLGLLFLYAKSGTLVIYDPSGMGGILDADGLAHLEHATISLPFVGVAAASTVIAILLFFGAMGKSAQFPLHVWLPDAMEGPTSVSALIHAATMVAAGVFMVARMFPLFALGGHHGELTAALSFVAWIGAITAILAAVIAVAQRDIKRVLAYSTISQLGFMMIGLGMGSVVAGFFHLISHAFFKALLFLGAGSVIHGCHHEQDMFKMGGLRKTMPVTFVTYLIGTLALAGIAPLSGFWSKDEILLYAKHGNPAIYWIASAAAFLTAFYMFRQIVLVFFGTERSHDYHAHESPKSMTVPLMILACFALFFGAVGCPFLPQGNLFHHFVAPGHHGLPPSTRVMIGSTIFAAAGVVLGSLIYGLSKGVREGRDPLKTALGPVYTVLENKFYIDELYSNTIIRFSNTLGGFFRALDELLINGTLHVIGKMTLILSAINQWIDNTFVNGGFDLGCRGILTGAGTLAHVQTGRIQDYLRIAAIGASLFWISYWATVFFTGSGA